MKRRWIALLLALTMAASLFAGCTQKTDTPPEPEQGQTQQEQTPNDQEEETPTPENPEQTPEEDGKTPSQEQTPSDEEPETELTPEQKLRRSIEACVAETTIWACDNDFDNPFTEEAVRYWLTDFLYNNWDNAELPVADWFEADDFHMNLYQNSLEEYTCVLSHKDSFDELYIRLTANGAENITPATVADPPKISAQVQELVDGAKFDKRYDGYYFDDKMGEEANKTFRAYAGQALNAFKQTIETRKDDWKVILDDAFRTSVSFDENDQFVFELQGKTSYWLELRYQPGCGVWSDVSLVPNEEEDWELDGKKLTDAYLLSLVTSLENGMTAEPFAFQKASELSEKQLWLMYLLLTPDYDLEATYQSADKMYHITPDAMDRTLYRYLEGYTLDISKDADYDEKAGEIVTQMVSGFGGGMASKLREKSVNGNTVTFTVDYYAYDDVDLTTSLHAKTYTITFYRGGYFYDSAVEAAV